ncbi:hypothetical protein L0Y26_09360 [Pectobacterium aroidearum]|uniref:hypothetical protein n=1 Tax=Pectobacterium aroidearum TaxID=1201031 RepID=UPI002113FD3C|nr:hypothetical protein [Pectobacterium aroidearum]UUE38099.1 hypothetical protein L0Y26_09360 [Pectobacterium aroidearum]UUE42474.1 hypothetical protein L0Y25_09360 [Pectobacterium aroidearum]
MDRKYKIYKGEPFTVKMVANSTIRGKPFNIDYTADDEHEAAFQTDEWSDNQVLVLSDVTGKIIEIYNVSVIDPFSSTDQLTHLRELLNDIEAVIEARIKNDNSQLTINNKTLIRESLEVLLRLKGDTTEKINKLKKKVKSTGTEPFFKSTIHFRFK